jgi:hypothetical protein
MSLQTLNGKKRVGGSILTDNVTHVQRTFVNQSERTENLPLAGILPLKAVPLFEFRLYISILIHCQDKLRLYCTDNWLQNSPPPPL